MARPWLAVGLPSISAPRGTGTQAQDRAFRFELALGFAFPSAWNILTAYQKSCFVVVFLNIGNPEQFCCLSEKGFSALGSAFVSSCSAQMA